ncbi:hypothetical protein AB0J55_22085 [Amycolatopsis sp. NPDC049688]|uniref:hypothetical protein n=1 Tax=Amycolatopsis sp. NPDC049688 TaxID=3154733 RepID=UPI00342365C3
MSICVSRRIAAWAAFVHSTWVGRERIDVGAVELLQICATSLRVPGSLATASIAFVRRGPADKGRLGVGLPAARARLWLAIEKLTSGRIGFRTDCHLGVVGSALAFRERVAA